MPNGWKRFVQYQKPMASMLLALALPTLMGVYCFGWRVLVTVAVAVLTCWAGEYYFTRKEGKPASMAALVSGALLALVCPPNLPFHYIILGSLFAIVFGKMVFGGFGKNIFNPAMVGRCFLYVLIPGLMTGIWFGPVPGAAGGFAAWTTQEPVALLKVADVPGVEADSISGATVLAGTKKLNRAASQVRATLNSPEAEAEARQQARRTFDAAQGAVMDISIWALIAGRIPGSQGETAAWAILLGLVFLLWRRVVKVVLVVGPVIGMVAGTVLIEIFGGSELPMGEMLLINLFAGGTMFAITFMTTEPVSAPMDNTARWIYGILIGLFAVTIRTFSSFNAGLMFSILLGNMFGPIIEIAVQSARAWWTAQFAAESSEEIV